MMPAVLTQRLSMLLLQPGRVSRTSEWLISCSHAWSDFVVETCTLISAFSSYSVFCMHFCCAKALIVLPRVSFVFLITFSKLVFFSYQKYSDLTRVVSFLIVIVYAYKNGQLLTDQSLNSRIKSLIN